MKINKILLFIACLAILSGVLSRCTSNRSNKSNKTNWAYNDKKHGGFEVKDVYEQVTGPGLVFIEGGMFTMGQAGEDLYRDWNNAPRRVTLDSYYIDEVAVSNTNYREYLHWISRVYVSYPSVYKNALPDTLVWRNPLAYNEPYVKTYFRHPAFNDYPVVGVSWRQANDYCLWRTDRVNEIILVKKGILKMDLGQKDANNFTTDAYLLRQYEGVVRKNLPDLSSPVKGATRPVAFDDGILLPNYRLPTEAEWEYAAVAPKGSSYQKQATERRLYPWVGTSLRNPEKKNRGQFKANFQRGRGDMMGVAGDANDGYALPAPVRSFYPNDFGLYCMSGNVNEWVADVYRPMSSEDVSDFRPFRGSVFTEVARDDSGNILSKDELGRMRYDTLGYDPSRYNYQLGDNRNYKDGDMLSSIDYQDSNATQPELRSNSARMYNPGLGRDNRDMASLVSDKSRVYKGGSFLDRPYWLSPGTRRFLDEDKSAIDIGFRCAMDRVGNPRKKGK
ncbi:MAG: SUMF1/EgtB/PvdO family nonheme iron enzyme [Prevotellaceae bacterium]|jgi:gliding motility-associated lipoprotein GldJ|nr:SUMF1/EgtB/PvdO family nonheme iron enzyme [Prevotellaceae bacterium]